MIACIIEVLVYSTTTGHQQDDGNYNDIDKCTFPRRKNDDMKNHDGCNGRRDIFTAFC